MTCIFEWTCSLPLTAPLRETRSLKHFHTIINHLQNISIWNLLPIDGFFASDWSPFDPLMNQLPFFISTLNLLKKKWIRISWNNVVSDKHFQYTFDEQRPEYDSSEVCLHNWPQINKCHSYCRKLNNGRWYTFRYQ